MFIHNYDVDEYLKGVEGEKLPDGFVDFLIENVPVKNKEHTYNQKVADNQEIEPNWNLYYEMEERWVDAWDQVMTSYRGYTKTASQIFDEVDRMALAFDVMGLEKGTTIVACMSDTPEKLVLLLAASKCGMTVNFVNASFKREMLEEIFNGDFEKKLFIATDDVYGKVSDLAQKTFADRVLISLTDSLENEVDPYVQIDSQVCKFVNHFQEFKINDPDLMSYSELLDISNYWVNHDNGFAKRDFYIPDDAIDLPLTVTYVLSKDGSILPMFQSNKSYVAMAKLHDQDLKGIPFEPDAVALSYFPPFSNMQLNSWVNNLSQNMAVAFEPLFSRNMLLYSMLMNKPAILQTTRSLLLETAKKMEEKSRLASEAFANTIVVSSSLEPISKSEENYINSVLKAVGAGKNIFRFRNVNLSVGAGDLEHGEIFFTYYKAFREKTSLTRSAKTDFGLKPLPTVDYAILNEFGEECDYDEYGRLVANSNCTMIGYSPDPTKKELSVVDFLGNAWDSLDVWGARLKNGNVLVKGDYNSVVELSNGQKVPYFMIADKLMEKNGVISCEVVKPKTNPDALVAHIYYDSKIAKACGLKNVLLGEIEALSQLSFSEELAERLVYKIRPFMKPFPIGIDGKRSISDLESEDLSDTYKPILGDKIEMTTLVPAVEYFEQQAKDKETPKQKIKLD